MNLSAHLPLVAALPLGLLGGLFAGWVHFRLLARNVELFAQGRLGPALGLQLARMLALATLLGLLLLAAGAASLLAALAGILVARTCAVHRVRREVR